MRHKNQPPTTPTRASGSGSQSSRRGGSGSGRSSGSKRRKPGMNPFSPLMTLSLTSIVPYIQLGVSRTLGGAGRRYWCHLYCRSSSFASYCSPMSLCFYLMRPCIIRHPPCPAREFDPNSQRAPLAILPSSSQRLSGHAQHLVPLSYS